MNPNPWIDMVAGIRRRTLVSGHTMMQMLVTLEPGSRLPEHQHPHEQVSHVINGRVRFIFDGGQEMCDVGAGESLYIPANRPHRAEGLEATLLVETFSPPREDLLVQDQRALAGTGTA